MGVSFVDGKPTENCKGLRYERAFSLVLVASGLAAQYKLPKHVATYILLKHFETPTLSDHEKPCLVLGHLFEIQCLACRLMGIRCNVVICDLRPSKRSKVFLLLLGGALHSHSVGPVPVSGRAFESYQGCTVCLKHVRVTRSVTDPVSMRCMGNPINIIFSAPVAWTGETKDGYDLRWAIERFTAVGIKKMSGQA